MQIGFDRSEAFIDNVLVLMAQQDMERLSHLRYVNHKDLRLAPEVTAAQKVSIVMSLTCFMSHGRACVCALRRG